MQTSGDLRDCLSCKLLILKHFKCIPLTTCRQACMVMASMLIMLPAPPLVAAGAGESWSKPKIPPAIAAELQDSGQLSFVDAQFDQIAFYPWSEFRMEGRGDHLIWAVDTSLDGRPVAYIAAGGRTAGQVAQILTEAALGQQALEDAQEAQRAWREIWVSRFLFVLILAGGFLAGFKAWRFLSPDTKPQNALIPVGEKEASIMPNDLTRFGTMDMTRYKQTQAPRNTHCSYTFEGRLAEIFKRAQIGSLIKTREAQLELIRRENELLPEIRQSQGHFHAIEQEDIEQRFRTEVAVINGQTAVGEAVMRQQEALINGQTRITEAMARYQEAIRKAAGNGKGTGSGDPTEQFFDHVSETIRQQCDIRSAAEQLKREFPDLAGYIEREFQKFAEDVRNGRRRR